MDEPADIARRDQEDATLREDLLRANASLERAANELRAEIEASLITRAEAIAALCAREQITEYGAAILLDNDRLPGPVHIWGKTVNGRIGLGQLPPFRSTEES